MNDGLLSNRKKIDPDMVAAAGNKRMGDRIQVNRMRREGRSKRGPAFPPKGQ
ncbi:hypothetical protein [Paenibacillus sp. NPDC057967]|uniref:hypothetical protein n=1 Tax=Paenibacillus sp. NPDC057967 TaxID=3346293 RepID=UPI0036D8E24D